VERLLAVSCPALAEVDEGGTALRSFAQVVGAVEAYCPWVAPVRPGTCSLPARGPARYFGGERALVRSIAAAASAITPVEVGVADGLFAAVLAARDDRIVPPGGTPRFLAPFAVEVLGDPELAELLTRLGIRTLGEFAALPEPHVLGRFGSDGVACHRVARGESGEVAGLRQPTPGPSAGHEARATATAPGFWGGVSDAEIRAARSLTAVQELLGPEGVVRARLQGGRGPAQQARFVTWNADAHRHDTDLDAPWPGRIPTPAPAIVHPSPLRAELAGGGGEPVAVSARGLLSASPARLSVEGGPWTTVTAWAGPWPSVERWWSRSRRRGARLQTVAGTDAYLLLVEGGRWWVEATYG
jgi:nucleotidyltransferase/DNA polymerase involved in DNA repair